MSKIVFVVEADQLFTAAIQSLLMDQENLIVRSGSVQAFLAEMREEPSIHPDLVVITDTLPEPDLINLIALIRRFPEVRIVLIHLQTNQIEVFDKRRHMLKHFGDFLNVL